MAEMITLAAAEFYAIFTADELKQFHAKHTPANTLFDEHRGERS